MPEDDAEPAVQTAPQEAPSDELLHDTDEEYLPKDQTSQKRKREGDEQLSESNRIRRRRQAPKEQVTKASNRKSKLTKERDSKNLQIREKRKKQSHQRDMLPNPERRRPNCRGVKGMAIRLGLQSTMQW